MTRGALISVEAVERAMEGRLRLQPQSGKVVPEGSISRWNSANLEGEIRSLSTESSEWHVASVFY